MAATKGLDIKVSGCPHGCGQHYIAGIGFQGGMRKLAGKPAPQYLVYVGGGIASDHADASAKIAGLAEELGFAPIEVGRIGEGGRLIQARNALVFQDLVKFGA